MNLKLILIVFLVSQNLLAKTNKTVVQASFGGMELGSKFRGIGKGEAFSAKTNVSLGYGRENTEKFFTSSHLFNIHYATKDNGKENQTSGIDDLYRLDYRYSFGHKGIKLALGPEFTFFSRNNSSKVDYGLVFGGEITSHLVVGIVNLCQQIAKFLSGTPPQYGHFEFVEMYFGIYGHQYFRDTNLKGASTQLGVRVFF